MFFNKIEDLSKVLKKLDQINFSSSFQTAKSLCSIEHSNDELKFLLYKNRKLGIVINATKRSSIYYAKPTVTVMNDSYNLSIIISPNKKLSEISYVYGDDEIKLDYNTKEEELFSMSTVDNCFLFCNGKSLIDELIDLSLYSNREYNYYIITIYKNEYCDETFRTAIGI